MACSDLRALHADVERLGPGRLELGLSLDDVDQRGDATAVARARQRQRALEGGDGGVEQPRLRVERAKLEVVQRQLRLQAQLRGL
jgi:hypothetical protein